MTRKTTILTAARRHAFVHQIFFAASSRFPPPPRLAHLVIVDREERGADRRPIDVPADDEYAHDEDAVRNAIDP